jgi:epoxyqueuosine reductase
MIPAEIKIKEEALRLGFSACGITKATDLEEFRPFYQDYLNRKKNGDMRYIETYRDKRLDPRLVFEAVRSIIAVLFNYYPEKIIPETDNFILSKYAYGRDYQVLIKERLSLLVSFMKQEFGEMKARPFVDSGPLLEKVWAQRCGVGWQGKHTILINQNTGSFFFIGIVFTDMLLEPDPPETDHCGNCSRCTEACPTNALSIPYQLDIPRCISYQTIVNKNTIPGEIARNLNNRIYGCDICQDVCPYNKFAKAADPANFPVNPDLYTLRKKDWINLTEEHFTVLFTGTPVMSKGYAHFMQTIRTVAENEPKQAQ